MNIFTKTLPARDRFFSPLWSQKALCPLTGGQGAAFCMHNENNSPEEAFSNINPSVKDISSLKTHLCREVYWVFFPLKIPQFLHNIGRGVLVSLIIYLLDVQKGNEERNGIKDEKRFECAMRRKCND